MLEPLLAGLHAGGFQAVDERQQLPLQPQHLCTGLADASVVLRELAHDGEVFGLGRDVLRPAWAAIGEDRAGMQLAVGAVALGFSTAAAERVQRTGEQRLPAEKDFEEFGELLLDSLELGAEDAEFVRDRLISGVGGMRL